MMVLVQGSQADLSALSPLATPHVVAGLRAQLCEGDRSARVRALSAILTAVALDLSDWGLR